MIFFALVCQFGKWLTHFANEYRANGAIIYSLSNFYRATNCTQEHGVYIYTVEILPDTL